MIGSSLSHYRISARLGAGGMGEVYRATDTKLGREVAIKVLPPELAKDAERLARFEREAKLLASLNHANIAHVYGFESATVGDGSTTHFLAMELVEGDDIAEHLKRGPIPLEDLLQIAKQIAEALEEAHAHGIVHRDLKPANVKRTPDGNVKVLDFGLAKVSSDDSPTASPADVSQSPTLSHKGTQAGVILGTAAYMSPEQARGGRVDKRADVWAFGVVLYEMLTGRQLFTGETASDILAGVLRSDIDLASLPNRTPAVLRQTLRRCLERDTRKRLHDIADARIVIEDVIAGPSEPVASAPVTSKTSARTPWLIAAATIVLAAIAVALARPASRPSNGTPSVMRLQFVPPQGERLAQFTFVVHRTFAVSPDGSQLAYVVEKGVTTELRLRALDSGVSTAIPGTEGAWAPLFSPDGKWLAFTADGKLEKVALAGGAPIVLADSPQLRGAFWAEDGYIYFVPTTYVPIARVPAAGGAVQTVTRIRTDEGEVQHRWPELLPGGRVLLYAVGHGTDWDEATIVAERLDSGERKVLVRGGTAPRYLPTGHLVYARAAGLYAIGLDARSLAVGGPPVEVARNVFIGPTGVADVDVSRTGILVSVPADLSGAGYVLSWVDRDGRGEPLKLAAAGYDRVSLSPSNDRAALGFDNGISILDLKRMSMSRLTLARRAEEPIWSRDGRRLYFGYEQATGFVPFSKAADDSGEPERAISGDAFEDPFSFSRDGARLLTVRYPADGANELRIHSLGGLQKEPRQLIKSARLDGSNAAFSPDDRWVVYQTRVSGRPEVCVRPSSGEDRKWQVSIDGGRAPIWSPAGDEIFFLCGEKFLAASIRASGDEIVVGEPKVLFDNHRVAWFDAARDGKRFLVAEDPNPGVRSRLDVVVNWFAEVERNIAAARAP